MPRAVAVLAVAFLTLLSAATDGQSQTSPPPAASSTALSITSLVDQVTALFPQLEGDVVEAQGQTLTLSIARKTGATPGLVLEAFREGREIRHPKTGAVLGKTEEALGRAVVTQVFDGYSVAAVDGPGAVKPGDRVRTANARVRIALLPLRAAGVRDALAEAATNEVYEALTRAGRFQVVSGDQVGAWMIQEKVSNDDVLAGRRVRDALQRFKIDHLLVLHYSMVERKPFVDARLFAPARGDAPALSTAFFVPPSVKPAPREQFSAGGGKNQAAAPKTQSLLARLLGIEADRATYSSGEGALALKEVARLGFPITGMDVSSSPGTQPPRMVVSDGEKIYVYRIVNRALEPDWTFSRRSIGRVISVQLADLGDGMLSVVANRFDGKIGMNSLIVGVRNGKPAVVVDQVDSILYAVDERGTGIKQTLWSQRYNEDGFFMKGYADKMTLRNGSLVREHSAVVPEPFRATGATFTNIAGKNSRGLAYIDDQNRLRITSGADEMWRSSSTVGGGGVKVEVSRHLERGGGRSYFYSLEPTPLSVDLDGDGVQEIVVPQNKDENGTIAVVYRSAAGIRMQQVNSGFEGVIGGFGAVPNDDGGSPTLITAVIRYKSFLKNGGETQILMTVGE